MIHKAHHGLLHLGKLDIILALPLKDLFKQWMHKEKAQKCKKVARYRPPKYTCLQYEDWNKSYSLFHLNDVLGFFREIGPIGYLHKEREGREKKDSL